MNCTIANCENQYYAKGFCKTHYDKNRRHNTPTFERDLKNSKPCAAGNCDRKVFSGGLCQMHYRRWKRHGDPHFINPKCNRDGNYTQRAQAKSAKWKTENRDINSAINNARKIKVRQAKLSSVEEEEILKVYSECPDGYNVDHIVPINHKNVCGLHVPWNMQYLSKSDNLKKSNKFDGTYDNNGWRQ